MAGWKACNAPDAEPSDQPASDPETKNPCESRCCRHIAGISEAEAPRVQTVLGVTSKGIYRGWSHSCRRWSDARHIGVNLSVDDDQAVPDRKKQFGQGPLSHRFLTVPFLRGVCCLIWRSFLWKSPIDNPTLQILFRPWLRHRVPSLFICPRAICVS